MNSNSRIDNPPMDNYDYDNYFIFTNGLGIKFTAK